MNSNQKANYSDSYRDWKVDNDMRTLLLTVSLDSFSHQFHSSPIRKKIPQMHLFSKTLPKFGLLSNPLTHKEWLASNFSPQYHPWIKH